jgi:thiaminase/transcriptional activator TenA
MSNTISLDVPYTVTPFARECLAQASNIWQAAHDHPFVKAIADGTLDTGRFRFYQMQDARYLESYADACALIASRCRAPEDSLWFIEAARRALVTERSLHLHYGEQLGYGPEDLASLECTPNNRAYQDHIISQAQRASLAEAVAAVAPCPWLYREIGRDLLAELRPMDRDHPYAEWLDRYADPEIDENIDGLLERLDRFAGTVDRAARQRAIAAFRTSIRYEWMFWEQAWEPQEWPV